MGGGGDGYKLPMFGGRTKSVGGGTVEGGGDAGGVGGGEETG